MILAEAEELIVKAYNKIYVGSPFEDEGWGSIESWDEISYIFDWNSKGIEVFEFDGRTIQKAEFDTGGEGHAEDVYMVFKTVDTDGTVQYWRKDGFYASHYGTDWDGPWREVNAVERVVTFYE